MNNTKLQKYKQDYDSHSKLIQKKTTIKKFNETSREKSKRIKELEKNYAEWFSYYFPQYAFSPCSWYHKKLAKLILNSNNIYVIQRVFRGGAKSVHSNIGVPLFLYLVKKDLKFMLLVGETEDKAKRLIGDIQAELRNNERIKYDYGNRFESGDWSMGNFITNDDVRFTALGLGQSPRGIRQGESRPDYISVDDVDTKIRCRNPKRVREAVEYIKEELWATFGKYPNRYVHSNNRFAKVSIVGQLSEHFNQAREEFKRENKKPIHHIIVVKAIMDNGKSGWEENYSLDFWKEKRIAIGERAFQREYQDNPIEEGTIFKNEWIQYKNTFQLRKYDSLILYGDLSYKEQGDYKALLFLGRSSTEFHIIKSFVRKTTRANVSIWLYDLYETMNLKKYPISYKIEGSFAQDEFVSDFDAEGKKRGYIIPVVADKKR